MERSATYARTSARPVFTPVAVDRRVQFMSVAFALYRLNVSAVLL
jgi:hypothetical protein